MLQLWRNTRVETCAVTSDIHGSDIVRREKGEDWNESIYCKTGTKSESRRGQ